MIVTRFCPSPTGYLHVGNARTAIINYLFSRRLGGKFILRMDDTDLKRSEEKFVEAAIEDLTWLGLSWQEFYRQSERISRYEKVKIQLEKLGKIYPCFESEDDLAFKRKIQLSRSLPPIYDRASLKLTKQQIQENLDSGLKPHYRFLLSDEEVSWNDGIRGEISFKSRSFSDPVIIRADTTPTYIFCSVIDDIDFGITDVIRGEDHISNTAAQIQIFQALAANLPNFHHLSLLKTKEGEISKRLGGFSIRDLRSEGIDQMAINSLLTKLGSSDNIQPVNSMSDLVSNFDLTKYSQAIINYDARDLLSLNHKIISKIEYEEAKEKLHSLGISDISEDFWLLIRNNISSYLEIEAWHKIFSGNFSVNLLEEEKLLIEKALEILPKDLSQDSYQSWLQKLSLETNKKGKDLYHPIRLAVTGLESGPELSKIIPLLGLETLKIRLQNAS